LKAEKYNLPQNCPEAIIIEPFGSLAKAEGYSFEFLNCQYLQVVEQEDNNPWL
jgi:hypothetical protein